MPIAVVRQSLLDLDAEAIVNAANTLMRGGGGIDGLIHQRAGHKLLLELQRVAPRRCEVGQVVITPGFELKQKWILHVPGPIWRGGSHGEADQLGACYRNAVEKAAEIGVQSVGFCSISTGVYGFPIELAAPIALREVAPFADRFEAVTFAMFGASEFEVFRDALAELA
ncbi:MAG: macro domain-containing protein [Armatimonadetes bacterium]|nr:hypothetical protein [Armatimonadota bacterium]MBS1702184.1 macro domain-containing protein [Armatimonadota bacterium]MBS1729133.1 macro domain-containing protein [Armatimonadota bacterium]